MTITEKLSKLLLQNEKYIALKANNEKVLNKTFISLQAREYDPELLTILQKDEGIKKGIIYLICYFQLFVSSCVDYKKTRARRVYNLFKVIILTNIK